MKNSTRVIEVVEMTRKEERALWNLFPEELKARHNIISWKTDDGNNEIRFGNEDFWRPVCIIEDATKNTK
jgi:hypothetical protein